ncbi:MAG: ParB/RepB/Spo0J family partition protein [Angelakisella sp.]
MVKKTGLGKGLDALFRDNESDISATLLQLRVSDIEPNKEQPRGYFDPAALQELADSIREHGVLQPIVVRAIPGGAYQIIAGERRWRASRLAELSEIPAVVVEADDNKVMELALIENLQRQDLSPIEEAQGYKTLMESYGLTQEQVAKRMGKSRPAITNAVRLLSLPERVLDELNQGEISAGHAKVLAGLTDLDQMNALLDRIIVEGLTVRQLEAAAKVAHKEGEAGKAPKEKQKEQSSWGDSWYKELELSLRDTLGRKVKISKKGKTGTLEIQFYSREELEEFAKLLSKGE